MTHQQLERWFSSLGWAFILLCAVEGLALTGWLAYRSEFQSPELIPPCAMARGGK